VRKRCYPLEGIAVYFYDPILLETTARLGFRVIWIEMEHGCMTFADDVECGPDIIEVPMIETPDLSVE
jgi:hypothetical protein